MTLGRILPFGLGLAASVLSGIAVAQHHGHVPSAPNPPRQTTDMRLPVAFPAELRDHTLANMRDHLAALQEIQAALAEGKNAKAASIAEERLGMSSLERHGAHEVARFMPQGMQDAGTAMHRAASRFAITAQDAEVTGDLRSAVAALAEVTAQCVGCHAGYRLK